MLQKMIDSRAEYYMMFEDDDKRMELSELRKEEERAVSVYWIIFVVTICLAGFCGWLLFIGNGQMYDIPFLTQGLLAAFIFFPIFLFIEIAWVRSSVKTFPMYVMLGTSVIAMLLSKFVLIFLVVYTVYFIFAEVKIIAMKLLPGYPAFHYIEAGELSKHMSYEQRIAYSKKVLKNSESKGQSAAQSDAELEKILRGEMDLDEYLGVVTHSKAEEMDELLIPDDADLEGEYDTESNRKNC